MGLSWGPVLFFVVVGLSVLAHTDEIMMIWLHFDKQEKNRYRQIL